MFNNTAYHQIKAACKVKNATLVAVTKRRSIEEIEQLYQTGHRDFGENRVQDLLEKKDSLPGDVSWHMIGHLQRNKVKFIAPFISMIHAVDSNRLLYEINHRAKELNRIIPCLLQFHIADEESKYGISPDELSQFMESIEWETIQNIKIRGVMGMASFVNDKSQIEREFKHLIALFNKLKSNYFEQHDFDTISMGMSGDFKIALENGSTMIRVGSALFD